MGVDHFQGTFNEATQVKNTVAEKVRFKQKDQDSKKRKSGPNPIKIFTFNVLCILIGYKNQPIRILKNDYSGNFTLKILMGF